MFDIQKNSTFKSINESSGNVIALNRKYIVKLRFGKNTKFKFLTKNSSALT